ncbi:MAG: PPC domain-containing protein [Candidatus Eisenbacteria bacterium]
MRLVKVCSSLVLVGTLAGVAYADPGNVEPKSWSYGDRGTTSVIPEAEPNDTCPGQAIACGDEVNPAVLSAGEEDWYYFTVNAGDEITIGTDSNGGTDCDTYLELYFGCGTTAVATNDDGGPGLYSLITYTAPVGGEYQAKVRGFSSTSAGDYLPFLDCAVRRSPENDRCNDNYAIDRCTGGSLEGDASTATNDYVTAGASGCTGYSANGRDVAYRMDLNAGDVVDLVYTQLQADASFYRQPTAATLLAAALPVLMARSRASRK